MGGLGGAWGGERRVKPSDRLGQSTCFIDHLALSFEVGAGPGRCNSLLQCRRFHSGGSVHWIGTVAALGHVLVDEVL